MSLKLKVKTTAYNFYAHGDEELGVQKNYCINIYLDNPKKRIAYLNFIKFNLDEIYDSFELFMLFDMMQETHDFYCCLLSKYSDDDEFFEVLTSERYIFYLERIFIEPEYRGNNEIPKKFRQTLKRCGAINHIVGCLPYPDKEISLDKGKEKAQKLLIRYLRKLGLKNFFTIDDRSLKAIIEWDYQ